MDRLIAQQVMVRVCAGVYRFAGTPESWEQRLAAALLRYGDKAVASHRSAAALWCLEPGWPDPPVEVTVWSGGHNSTAGVVTHRTGLLAHETRHRNGFKVTSPARTLVDLSPLCATDRLEVAVDDALRRRLTSVAELGDVLETVRRPGSPSTKRISLVIDRRREAATESPLERTILRAIRQSGVMPPQSQFVINAGEVSYRVDFAWPQLKLALEVNGFAFHGTRLTFDADARKAAVLVAAGWTVVPVTSASTEAELYALLHKLVPLAS